MLNQEAQKLVKVIEARIQKGGRMTKAEKRKAFADRCLAVTKEIATQRYDVLSDARKSVGALYDVIRECGGDHKVARKLLVSLAKNACAQQEIESDAARELREARGRN